MATVEDLIKDVERGELMLPEFQRGYVWSRDQVKKLVESVYRTRPTGHFLIWHAYGEVLVRGAAASPAHVKKLLLLDGQQRLTSLFVLFRGVAPPFYEGEHLFFDLRFNVATETFEFWNKTRMSGDPAWISVPDFLKEGTNGLLRRLGSLPPADRELLEANLERIGRLDDIRKYPYHIDELKDDSLELEDVVTIFNNVNSSGTTLEQTDLALAQVTTIWPEGRAILRDFKNKMQHEGFGIDLMLLLRATLAVAGVPIKFRPGSLKDISKANLQTAWGKVETGAEELINVLRRVAFVDSIDDLRPVLPVVPLLVHLARTGGHFHSDVERDRFLRWMFLAMIWGRYTGQTETRLQRDLNLLSEKDPAQHLVGEILADRGRVRLEPSDLAEKTATSALYRFAYIVARARGAQDWFTGTPLYSKSLGRSNGLESHHIFPRDVLTKAGYVSREQKRLVNEVANRAFLTQRANRTISNKPPSKYLPKVVQNYSKVLTQQSVPHTNDLWTPTAFEEFLAQRRRMLARSMNGFLDRLAHIEDQQSSLDPYERIRALIESKESDRVEFKSSLRWDREMSKVNKSLEKSVCKTVAAFLNRRGGTLLIGVADDGEVGGLEADYETLRRPGRDGFEAHLLQILSTAVGEAAVSLVSTTFHLLDGRDVCQIQVGTADDAVYYREGDTETFYLRIGNASRQLSVHEAVRYITSHWHGADTYEPTPEVEPADTHDQEAEDGRYSPGAGAFLAAVAASGASAEVREEVDRLTAWAVKLEGRGHAVLESGLGTTGQSLIVGVADGDASMVTVGHYGEVALYFYRGVIERRAAPYVARIQTLISPIQLGQGRKVTRIPDTLLALLADAYAFAADLEDDQVAELDVVVNQHLPVGLAEDLPGGPA
jgi:hypothetical protein